MKTVDLLSIHDLYPLLSFPFPPQQPVLFTTYAISTVAPTASNLAFNSSASSILISFLIVVFVNFIRVSLRCVEICGARRKGNVSPTEKEAK